MYVLNAFDTQNTENKLWIQKLKLGMYIYVYSVRIKQTHTALVFAIGFSYRMFDYDSKK